MLDTEGRVTSWNPGAERIEGYRSQEILGRNYSLFHTPEDVAAGLPSAQLVAALRKGRYEGEGWRVRKDQSRFYANVVIAPIRDQAGVHRGFVKVTRDLTELKRAE